MLVWCDLETTGLDPHVDRILEIALVVTDDDLSSHLTLNQVIRQDDDFDFLALDDFIKQMHVTSGLFDDLPNAQLDIAQLENFLLQHFTNRFGTEQLRVTPMAGSNVSFDREFLRHHMPRFEALFSYRNVDVSSFKELVNRWSPEVQEERSATKGLAAHRALADIHESIDELNFYRERIWRTYTECQSMRAFSRL